MLRSPGLLRALGHDRTQVVEPLSEKDFKEDEMYHHAHCARVVAEMVRPSVPLPNYGGFNYEKMRIAGL